jgi:DNA-binding NarL/FixJ family response regulator
MGDRLHALREAANLNWARALQTYRSSATMYRRVLSARAQRELYVSQGTNGHEAPKPSPGPLKQTPLDVLSPRELEVAQLVARGCTNQQIANALVLTRGTVANHIAHVLAKLGMSNRTQVAALVIEVLPGAHANGAQPRRNGVI